MINFIFIIKTFDYYECFFIFAVELLIKMIYCKYYNKKLQMLILDVDLMNYRYIYNN